MAIYQKRNGKIVKISGNKADLGNIFPVNPGTEGFLSLPDIPVLTAEAGRYCSFITSSENKISDKIKIKEFILTTVSPYTRRVFAANEDGTSEIKFPVPDNQISITIKLQAVDELGNTSNVNTKTIQLIHDNYIKPPVITSPKNRYSIGTNLTITTANYDNPKDRVISADYKICSDVLGTDILASVQNVTSPTIFSATFENLDAVLTTGKNYFIFACFRGEIFDYSDWSAPVTVTFTEDMITESGRTIRRHPNGKGSILTWDDGFINSVFVADYSYWRKLAFGGYNVDISSVAEYPYGVRTATTLPKNANNNVYLTNVNSVSTITDLDFNALWPFYLFTEKSSAEIVQDIKNLIPSTYKDTQNIVGLPAIQYCESVEVEDNQFCCLPKLSTLDRIMVEIESIQQMDPTEIKPAVSAITALSCSPTDANTTVNSVTRTTNSTVTRNAVTGFCIPVLEYGRKAHDTVIAPSGRKFYRHVSNRGTVMEYEDADGSTKRVVILDARYRTSGYLCSTSTDDLQNLPLNEYSEPNVNNNWFLNGVASGVDTAEYALLTDEQLNTLWANSIDKNSGQKNSDILDAVDYTIVNNCRKFQVQSRLFENQDLIGCSIPNFQTMIRIFCDAETIDALDPTVGTDNTIPGNVCGNALGSRNPNGYGAKSYYATSTLGPDRTTVRTVRYDGDCEPVSAVTAMRVVPVLEISPKTVETPTILNSQMVVGTEGTFLNRSPFTVVDGGYDEFESIEYRYSTDAVGQQLIQSGEINPVVTQYLPPITTGDMTVGQYYYLSIRYKAKEFGYTDWSVPIYVIVKQGLVTKGGRVLSRHSSGMGTVLEYCDYRWHRLFVADKQYGIYKRMYTGTAKTMDLTKIYNPYNMANATTNAVNASGNAYINGSSTWSSLEKLDLTTLWPWRIFPSQSSKELSDLWTSSYPIAQLPALEYCETVTIEDKTCHLPSIWELIQITQEYEELEKLDSSATLNWLTTNFLSCNPHTAVATNSNYVWVANGTTATNIVANVATTYRVLPVVELDYEDEEETNLNDVITAPSGRKFYRHYSNKGTVMEYNDNGIVKKAVILDARYRYSGALLTATNCDTLDDVGLDYVTNTNKSGNYYINGKPVSITEAATISDKDINDSWRDLLDSSSSEHNTVVLNEKLNGDNTNTVLNTILNTISYQVDFYVNGESHLQKIQIPNINLLIRIFCDAEIIDSLDPTVGAGANTLGNVCGNALGNRNSNGKAWQINKTLYALSSTISGNGEIRVMSADGDTSSIKSFTNCSIIPVLEVWPKAIEKPSILNSPNVIGTDGTYLNITPFVVTQGAYDVLLSTGYKITLDENGNNIVQEGEIQYPDQYIPSLDSNINRSKLYYLFVRYNSKEFGYSDWSDCLHVSIKQGLVTKGGRVLSRHSSGMGTVMEYYDYEWHKLFIADQRYWIAKAVTIYSNQSKFKSASLYKPYNNTSINNIANNAYVNGTSTWRELTHSDFYTLWPNYLFPKQTAAQVSDIWRSSYPTDGNLPAQDYCATVLVDGKPCYLPLIDQLMHITQDYQELVKLDTSDSVAKVLTTFASCSHTLVSYDNYLTCDGVTISNLVCNKASRIIPVLELETNDSTISTTIAPSGRKFYRHFSNKGTVMEYNDNGVIKRAIILDARYRITGTLLLSNTFDLLNDVGLPVIDSKNTKDNWFVNGVGDTSPKECHNITEDELNALWSDLLDTGTSAENTAKLNTLSSTLITSLKAITLDFWESDKNVSNLYNVQIPNINLLIRIFCDAEIIDALDPTVGHDASILGNVCNSALNGRNPNGDWKIAGLNNILSSTFAGNGELRVVSFTGDTKPIKSYINCGVIPVIEIWPEEIVKPEITTGHNYIGTLGTWIDISPFEISKGAWDLPRVVEYKITTDEDGNNVLVTDSIEANAAKDSNGKIVINNHYLKAIPSIISGKNYYLFVKYVTQTVQSAWSSPYAVTAKTGYVTKYGRIAYRHSSGMGTVLEYNDGQDRKLVVLDAIHRGIDSFLATAITNSLLTPLFTYTAGAISVDNCTDELLNTSTDTVISGAVRNRLPSRIESGLWSYVATNTTTLPALAHCKQLTIDDKPCYLPNNDALVRILAEYDIINRLDETGNISLNAAYWSSSKGTTSSSYNFGIMTNGVNVTLTNYNGTIRYFYIPVCELDEPGTSEDCPIISKAGRRIYSSQDGMSVTLEYDGKKILIPGSLYRNSSLKFGTSGTDVTEVENKEINNSIGNAFIDGVSAYTVATLRDRATPDSKLDAIWTQYSAANGSQEAKELNDLWMERNTVTDSGKTVGVPLVAFARSCIIPSYGRCDLPTLDIAMRMFLESQYIDVCDPTYHLRSAYSLCYNNVGRAIVSCNENSSTSIVSLAAGTGTSTAVLKTTANIPVQMLDTANYTTITGITETGRKVYRHSSDIGSVLEYDNNGTVVRVLVLDAKYRFASQFSTSIPSEGSNILIPELPVNSGLANVYVAGRTSTPYSFLGLSTSMTLTEDQVNTNIASPDVNNSYDNCNVWIEYEDTAAVHGCRELDLSSYGIMSQANVPNINTLCRIHIEAVHIDRLDPTVIYYPELSLFALYKCGYFSSTPSSATAMLSLNVSGQIVELAKNSSSVILPTVDL